MSFYAFTSDLVRLLQSQEKHFFTYLWYVFFCITHLIYNIFYVLEKWLCRPPLESTILALFLQELKSNCTLGIPLV